MIETYTIPSLPLKENWETIPILKAASRAHRCLAELKGRAASIPNESVLLSTLSLQEANSSSKIESIVTTQDELFRSSPKTDDFASPAAKEVHKYYDALMLGYEKIGQRGGVLSNNLIILMFQVLKETQEEFRKTTGTALRNDKTGEVVFVPPQSALKIQEHMSQLEKYINSDEGELLDLDPLIRLAIIHHQFESIHPFSDGNGRLGRLINVLFLVKEELLETPILYLSRYITDNKDDYYRLLQYTRDTGDWEPWILFILDAVAVTSKQTTILISQIKTLMADYKEKMRHLGSVYSQDLLNNLFRHPYTRIEYVMDELAVSRPTATRYLRILVNAGLLEEMSVGKNKYFINAPLANLFIDVSS